MLGRPEETAAREAHWRGPRRGAAHAGLPPEPRRLTGRGPRVSETGRGAEEDDGATRRRWLLQRRQRCQRFRLTQADIGEQSIAANDAARGGGDGHGGARPRLDLLRRIYGVTAPNGDPTSFLSAP